MIALHTMKRRFHTERKSFFASFNDEEEGYLSTTSLIIISAALVMIVASLIAFLINIKGEEEVLIPDVTGKQLEEALTALQEKELYPRISLRFSDDPKDKGIVKAQKPKAGSLTKGFSRVALTVSRGALISSIGDYIGKTYDEVKDEMALLFYTAKEPLIRVAPPVYKTSSEAEGTIIAQSPAKGTELSSPVTLTLIVSRGSEDETVQIPPLAGKTLKELYKVMQSTPLVFDFSVKRDEEAREVSVISSSPAEGNSLKSYSRVKVLLSMPVRSEKNKTVAGILEDFVGDYPRAVKAEVRIKRGGKTHTLLEMRHTGGVITIPYEAEEGDEISLYVMGKKIKAIPAGEE